MRLPVTHIAKSCNVEHSLTPTSLKETGINLKE